MKKSFKNMKSLLAMMLVAAGLFASVSQAAADKFDKSKLYVGMEKTFEFKTNGRLFPRNSKTASTHTAEGFIALDKLDVIIRIAEESSLGNGNYFYKIAVIPNKPGTYNLKNYLAPMRATPNAKVPSREFTAVSVLSDAEKVNTSLDATFKPKAPFLNEYDYWFWGVPFFWLLMWIPIMLIGRKRKASQAVTHLVKISMAEQLAPLVNQAAIGKLNRIGKAKLELLLLAYWKKQLCQPGVPMSEAMQVLRNHPEAGALINAVEQWLHRPAGTYEVDVEQLLAPYRNLPAIDENQLQEVAR